MKEISLSQGKVAKVSDHRFEYCNQWIWSAVKIRNKWYASRHQGKRPFRKTIFMHRDIMGVINRNIIVDHKDGDGLNCQDENLRTCTNAQNLENRGKQSNNTSGYKGVTKISGRWYAQLRRDGMAIFREPFNTPEEAAHAYDKAAKKYHGEFAKLNFQEETS